MPSDTGRFKQALKILFRRTDDLQNQTDRIERQQQQDRRRVQQLGEQVSWLLAWKASVSHRLNFQEDNGLSAYEVMSMSRTRAMLEELFTMDNLKTLCFDLGLDHEALGCDNKEELSRELVGEMWRNGRFWELVAVCRERRPGVVWPVQVE